MLFQEQKNKTHHRNEIKVNTEIVSVEHLDRKRVKLE